MSVWSDLFGFMGGRVPAAVEAQVIEQELGRANTGGLVVPDPPRIRVEADDNQGGFVIQGGTTLGSILDSQYGLGLPPIILFGGRAVMTRELAVTYAAVYRCSSIISGAVADLLTNGIRVVDTESKKTISNPQVRDTIRMIMESPNDETPAYEWWEDFLVDYLLDGNALAYVERVGNRINRLRLLRPWDAYANETEMGPVYSAHPDDQRGAQIKASYKDIVHARWPRYSSRGAVRRHFALSPINVLSTAIRTGIETDDYVSDFYSGRDGGVRGKLAVTFKDHIDSAQRAQIIESISKYARSREPLVLMGDAGITQLTDKAQDNEVLELRKFQVSEIGRVYGVPAPLLGVEVTSWGSGIEQLSRLFYRYGAKQHLMRMLDPLSLRLLPRGQKFAVDETQMLKGDMKEMGEFFAKTLGGPNGPAVISIEEARDMLGFDIDNIPDQPDYSSMRPASDSGGTSVEDDDSESEDEEMTDAR